MTGTSARGRRGCLNEATREELDQSEDAHEIVGVVVGGVAVLRCLSRGACPMVPVPRRAAASSPCLSHAAAACLSQARACPTPPCLSQFRQAGGPGPMRVLVPVPCLARVPSACPRGCGVPVPRRAVPRRARPECLSPSGLSPSGLAANPPCLSHAAADGPPKQVPVPRRRCLSHRTPSEPARPQINRIQIRVPKPRLDAPRRGLPTILVIFAAISYPKVRNPLRW